VTADFPPAIIQTCLLATPAKVFCFEENKNIHFFSSVRSVVLQAIATNFVSR
jgi:hypothetical protein